jgi:predicted AlkP superfamily phosphohydrolase/phosphomutase
MLLALQGRPRTDLYTWIFNAVEDKETDYVYIDIGEADKAGHVFGPDSDEIRQEMARIDSFLQKVHEHVARTCPEYAVIIMSDHGMSPIHSIVDLEGIVRGAGLLPERDYVCFIDSACLRLWGNNNEKINIIKEVLSGVQGVNVLSPERLSQLRITQDLSADRDYVGDVTAVADPGVLILPNYFQGKRPVKGMHGYIDDGSDYLGGVFFLTGSSIQPKSMERVELVDTAPTILDIFGINNELSMDGKSVL